MAERLHAVLLDDEASFLRLILDNVSDALVVVDTEGQIVVINQPYCDLLGGQADEFIGRHIREAVSPHSHLDSVARGGKPRPAELLKVRGGQEIVTKQVPIWLDGEIIGALGMALFASSQLASTTLRRLSNEALVIPRDSSPWRARYSIDDIVGRGPEMTVLKDDIRQAARHVLPVLIHGETGTGKELVAQAIHRLSQRAARPFVWINCATIPVELVASELFGYEAGSFTSASSKGGKGKLELAHEGTVFLDEIGDMPLHAQASLLRFLQEKEITRVGGTRPITLDVRVISASHRNLNELAASGRFRADLLYRLRVLDIQVPALRDRKDIDLLISHLVTRTRLELGLARLALSKKAREQLRGHSWPGNVRELLAVIQREAVRLAETEFEISGFRDLQPVPAAVRQQGAVADSTTGGLGTAVAQTERDTIQRMLDVCGGNRSEAARRLGVDRSGLYKRMRALGLTTAK